MSTQEQEHIMTDNDLKGRLMTYEFLINYVEPNISKRDKERDIRNILRGHYSVTSLWEEATAKIGGQIRTCVFGMDNPDGGDNKYAVTGEQIDYNTRKDGTKKISQIRMSATVGSVKTKKHFLRVMVMETKTGIPYFFLIPRYAYEGLSSIPIYFNEDGSPKLDGKWFKYMVDSIEAVSKIQYGYLLKEAA